MLGSRVLAALRRHCDELLIEGVGGALMEAEGLQSLFPVERLSVMGFVEPLRRLPELVRLRARVYRHFCDNPPDLFLGIDSPDFNLRLEQKLRRRGIPTCHLVSPSVWAWRQGRLGKIKRAVDLMLCLFPFETQIYQRHGIPARFVGHPLADEIPESVEQSCARAALALAPPGKLLALLPGSRSAEVRLLAPLFLQVAARLWREDPRLSFVIPAAGEIRYRELQQALAAHPTLPVTLLRGNSRQAMAAADLVLLASGTATLEAALLKRPMVVAYRMSAPSWWLVSRLVRTPYAALPNILAGEALVPEFIQGAANEPALVAALQELLIDGGSGRRQQAAFVALHQQLRRDFSCVAAEAVAQQAYGAKGNEYGRSVSASL